MKKWFIFVQFSAIILRNYSVGEIVSLTFNSRDDAANEEIAVRFMYEFLWF